MQEQGAALVLGAVVVAADENGVWPEPHDLLQGHEPAGAAAGLAGGIDQAGRGQEVGYDAVLASDPSAPGQRQDPQRLAACRFAQPLHRRIEFGCPLPSPILGADEGRHPENLGLGLRDAAHHAEFLQPHAAGADELAGRPSREGPRDHEVRLQDEDLLGRAREDAEVTRLRGDPRSRRIPREGAEADDLLGPREIDQQLVGAHVDGGDAGQRLRGHRQGHCGEACHDGHHLANPAEPWQGRAMQHGGDLTTAMAVHGGTREAWLDLSTGINPFAWPVPGSLSPEAWTGLPTQGALDRLLAAARQAYGVPEDVAIVAAPGTQSLIQWLPQLAPDGPVAIVQPTYAEHALAWRRAGHEVIAASAAMPLPDATRHLVIVNPNNPDGHLFGQDRLADLAVSVARRGGWLVIDESFIDVVPDASAVVLCRDLPVLILRSFGKFYGLPGLRLGFLLAGSDIAGQVAEALGPWSVAGPALEIGAAALGDDAYARTMRAQLAHEAAELDLLLGEAGLDVVGGTTLYRLVRHPLARRLHEQLARRHVWVRRFDWDGSLLRFGLPPDDLARQRLAAALKNGLAEAHVGDHGTRTG